MDYEYDYCVYIGRFQPFHLGHLETVKVALQKARKVIILIGSHKAASNLRNPWSAEQRMNMIQKSLPAEAFPSRVAIGFLRDYLYNETTWVMDVQTKVSDVIDVDRGFEAEDTDPRVALIGFQKDASSYYLDLFPQWEYIEFPDYKGINSTDIRSLYFGGSNESAYWYVLPVGSQEFLNRFRDTDEYRNLCHEYEFIAGYKERWSQAPYAPTFVTTDAVVVQSGHVLLVRRRAAPGKGLIALPGGFLGQDETILDGVIRELKEETGIKVPPAVLKGSIAGNRVFDSPNRSIRGRTITHAYYFHLSPGTLPRVKGSDDADKAWWRSLADVVDDEDKFYEDHYQIIQHFVQQN